MLRIIEVSLGLYFLLLLAAAVVNAVPWAPRSGEVEKRRKLATVAWWGIILTSIWLGLVVAVATESLAKDDTGALALLLWFVGLVVWVTVAAIGIWSASRVLKRFPFHEDSASARFQA